MRSKFAVALAALFLFLGANDAPKEDPAVTQLLQQIKGQENKPAGEVFKNVQLLENIPAGRFLRIMDVGYSRSLGVGCDHCHSEDRWEADEKRAKLAAREMILLVQDINRKLESMEHIDTSEPQINCTTCHRGYVKPATQMK
jgi:Photosynthetic reaction centre cytochrome C subunit